MCVKNNSKQKYIVVKDSPNIYLMISRKAKIFTDFFIIPIEVFHIPQPLSEIFKVELTELTEIRMLVI